MLNLFAKRGSTPSDSSDVLINSIHFNGTALQHFNYNLYSNGTLSNSTQCFLAFGPYHPAMAFPANLTHPHHHGHQNNTSNNASSYYYDWQGAMVNTTSCYSPVNQMGQHATLSVFFALFFALCIILSSGNLHKHGRRYHALLSVNRRFGSSSAGRRAQWLWLLFLAVCATISCFMGVDVDRDYLQSTPLMLQGLFYTLLTPGLMAAVWEAVRHWQGPRSFF